MKVSVPVYCKSGCIMQHSRKTNLLLLRIYSNEYHSDTYFKKMSLNLAKVTIRGIF